MADAKVIPFDEDRPRRRIPRRVRAVPAADPVVEPPAAPEPAPAAAPGDSWDRRIAGGLAFLRRRVTGDYEVDDFGYDKELTDQVLMTLMRPLYDKYFRVEVKGIENIPAQGGALIVANHSGTLPLDGLMLQVAVHDPPPGGAAPATAGGGPGVHAARRQRAGPQGGAHPGVRGGRAAAAGGR